MCPDKTIYKYIFISFYIQLYNRHSMYNIIHLYFMDTCKIIKYNIQHSHSSHENNTSGAFSLSRTV